MKGPEIKSLILLIDTLLKMPPNLFSNLTTVLPYLREKLVKIQENPDREVYCNVLYMLSSTMDGSNVSIALNCFKNPTVPLEVIKTFSSIDVAIYDKQSYNSYKSYKKNYLPFTLADLIAADPMNIDLITRAIKAGLDVNAKGLTGLTAPMVVAANPSNQTPRLLDLMLAAGADLNIRDSSGQTMLQRVKGQSAMQPALTAYLGRAGTIPFIKRSLNSNSNDVNNIINDAQAFGVQLTLTGLCGAFFLYIKMQGSLAEKVALAHNAFENNAFRRLIDDPVMLSATPAIRETVQYVLQFLQRIYTRQKAEHSALQRFHDANLLSILTRKHTTQRTLPPDLLKIVHGYLRPRASKRDIQLDLIDLFFLVNLGMHQPDANLLDSRRKLMQHGVETDTDTIQRDLNEAKTRIKTLLSPDPYYFLEAISLGLVHLIEPLIDIYQYDEEILKTALTKANELEETCIATMISQHLPPPPVSQPSTHGNP